MPTVDLTAPVPTPEGTLEGLPRRLALTLPELQLLAERAGGAPLPFELVQPDAKQANPLEDRLGKSRGSVEDEAYAAALGTLHDPAESLTKRGILVDGTPEAAVIGALGLLATPTVAVDIDLNIDGVRAKAWHRQRESAVATLATTDGVVFELAWFESSHWPAELGRIAVRPEEQASADSAAPARDDSRVGDLLDLPHSLLDAGAEAVRTNRADLLGSIVAHHSGTARDGSGALSDAEAGAAISALVSQTEGRLRALVADVGAGGNVVGVVSWVLLPDGWRSLRPHREDGLHRVEIRRVEASDLATDLGPVLAEVSA